MSVWSKKVGITEVGGHTNLGALLGAGEYAPMDISARTTGFRAITRLFPIGAVSMVSPFNFPLNLTAHKIAPALAVG